jgi:hypothetical protein
MTPLGDFIPQTPERVRKQWADMRGLMAVEHGQ